MTDNHPSGRSKILKIFLAFGVLLLVSLGAGLYAIRSFLDADRLVPQLVAEVGHRAGLELTIKDVRSIGLRGVELGGLKASGSASGSCLSATAEGLRIRWQLRPIFQRRIVVDELLVLSPNIEAVALCGNVILADQGESVSGGDDPTHEESSGSQTAGSKEATSSVSLEVSLLRLKNGQASLRETRDGPIDFLISDFSADFSEVNLQGAGGSFWQKASGTLEAAQLTAGNLVATEFEGTLELTDGKMVLSPATLSIDQGTVRIDTTVDLEHGLASELEVNAQLALDSILSPDRATDSRSMGTGEMTLSGQAAAPDPAALIAEGAIIIPAGSLGKHPVTTALALALSTSELLDFQYAPTTGRFRIEDGTFFFTEPLVLAALESSDLAGWSLEVAGQAGIDAAVAASLGVTIHAKIPRLGIDIAEIPEELLNLLEDEEGFVLIPILLSGSLEDPKVGMDTRALRQTTSQGLKREAGKQIRRGLRRLLEDNRE